MTDEETLAWEQDIFDQRKISVVGEYDGDVEARLLEVEDGLLSNSQLNPGMILQNVLKRAKIPSFSKMLSSGFCNRTLYLDWQKVNCED